LNYTTLLFDLDETLFDFFKSERYAACKLMELYGIPATNENYELYSAINDEKWRKLEKGEITRPKLLTERFADFFGEVGVKVDPSEANLAYMKLLSKASFLLDGALDTCKKLSQNYTLYLVTNGTKYVQTGRLNGSPIMKYIKDVFISEEIGFNKPQREYFDYVLNHIDEKDKSEILVIGDSLSSDIAGAVNSGLDCCWVNRKNQDIKSPATFEIKSVTELLDILNT
jgi:YjjG family noncanonical pyrimidine nucleotidase